MTPISQHLFKPSTIIGLSLYGVIRFGGCVLLSFAAMPLVDLSFVFAILPPSLLYVFEFVQTKKEPDRDTILNDRFMTALGRLGLQDSQYPPSLPVPGWSTGRTFYGP
jgi:hypothetical protein